MPAEGDLMSGQAVPDSSTGVLLCLPGKHSLPVLSIGDSICSHNKGSWHMLP